MAFRFEGSGTLAVVTAGISAMKAGTQFNDATLLANVIADSNALVTQFAAAMVISPPITTPNLHVVVQGHAGKKTMHVSITCEQVLLDPQGRIVANAFFA